MIKRGLAGFAVAVALAFIGCGDGDSESSTEAGPDADPVGQELGGSVSQLVQCSDWEGATEEQKLATIEDVRSHVNPQDVGVDAPELTDEEAMDVFDTGCSKPYAQGFRLYLLYARAVAFKPLKDIAEGNVEAPSD